MAKVYLETSFVSACVSDRTDAASVYRRDISLSWWSEQARWHDVSVSAEVFFELSSPGYRRSTEALKLIETLPLLSVTPEVTGIAAAFVREQVMPGPPGAGDSIHVALACVHGIDYVLSWNVKHLANVQKLNHLRVVCRRLGVVPPLIITPDLLWGVKPDDQA